jgi:hypothetical protein
MRVDRDRHEDDSDPAATIGSARYAGVVVRA